MYRVFILDLDGTVYVDGNPILDVIDRLNKLTKEGVFILFLTNNTSLNKVSYVEKLTKMGLLFVTEDNLLSPIDVFISFAKLHNINSCYYLLPEKVVDFVSSNGGPVSNNKNPEMVLVGFDKELTYGKLQIASEFINKNIPYYITHIDYACPSSLGPIPDCGAIASLINKTTEKGWVDHFGKPGTLMAKAIEDVLLVRNLNGEKAVLIGDRYYTDIKLGNILNIDTVHVQTGENNRFPENDSTPTFEYDNISNFIEWQYTVK